ncbi:MAG: histidine kinase, partial [Elusimicrobia bacterium]
SVYLSRLLSEAQALGQMKTQLVAMVSHEFNNSLSVLGGMARLLKEDEPKPPDPKRANYFTVIEAHVRSLAVAARTLLELGRFEAGRLKVHPVRMDLTALARSTASALEVLWSRKGQTVGVTAPAAPVWVHGDPDALALVATNLLANAVKYTPEKGTITLGVEAEAGGARFYISDTGIGIAPEDQARILSGYFRTEEGKKAAKGFGVGLALSQSLLLAHGAELRVESASGRGARFSFFLPAAPG